MDNTKKETTAQPPKKEAPAPKGKKPLPEIKNRLSGHPLMTSFIRQDLTYC